MSNHNNNLVLSLRWHILITWPHSQNPESMYQAIAVTKNTTKVDSHPIISRALTNCLWFGGLSFMHASGNPCSRDAIADFMYSRDEISQAALMFECFSAKMRYQTAALLSCLLMESKTCLTYFLFFPGVCRLLAKTSCSPCAVRSAGFRRACKLLTKGFAGTHLWP